MTLLLLGLLACDRPGGPIEDPRFEPLRQSLRLYDEGVATLDADPARAAQLFAQASEQDPRSAELHLWRGVALAAAGDVQGAVEAADAALALDRNLVEARYNRACWKTRLGDLEGAHADLKEALLDQRIDPLAAALDPDLTPLVAAYDDLPRPELACSAEVPDEAVFVGSDWTMALECTHRPDESLRIEGPPLPAPFEHVRSVELRSEEGPLRRTRLELTFTVRGAHEGPIGPWSFDAGGLSGSVPEGTVRFLAPEGHVPPSGASSPWTLPSGLLPQDGVRRDGERVTVRAEPGDRLEWPAGRVVRYELREKGALAWIGWAGDLAPGQELVLRRGQQELYRQQP